jgi:hypothetical protein
MSGTMLTPRRGRGSERGVHRCQKRFPLKRFMKDVVGPEKFCRRCDLHHAAWSSPVMAMIVVRGHERFNSKTTLIPSLFGIKMSVMTTSGGFVWHMAMPALPAEAYSPRR